MKTTEEIYTIEEISLIPNKTTNTGINREKSRITRGDRYAVVRYSHIENFDRIMNSDAKENCNEDCSD